MNKYNSPSASEQAYLEFLDTLRDAVKVINGPLGARDERERAEGLRHLLRLASLATEQFVEKGSIDHPQFTRWMDAGRKLLGDNPWTIYDSAQVFADNTYRIYGQRGESTYMGFCVYGTTENGDRCIVSNIDDTDMSIDESGHFELFLGRDRPVGASNWVALDDRATDVMVRQYFLDNDHSKQGLCAIEKVGVTDKPGPVSDDVLAEQINKAAEYFTEVINVEANISALMEESTPVLLRNGDSYDGDDDAIPIDFHWVAKALPTAAITYTGSWVANLGDDEAMVVEGIAPEARYWSVQLLSRWMESPDYVNNQVFFSSNNVVLDENGRFRIVIAHRDPGVDNWLNTTGLRNANIAFRALHARSPELDVSFSRVKLAELSH